MKTYRILVPTDFSDHSDAALQLATSLAKDHMPAMIHLAYVEEAVVPYQDEELGVFEPNQLIATAKLAHTERDPQVPMETTIVHGQPAGEILKFAMQHQVDLILMGTHGRTGLAHVLMGSVAEAVIRRSTCPVMTVKSFKSNPPQTRGAGLQSANQ